MGAFNAITDGLGIFEYDLDSLDEFMDGFNEEVTMEDIEFAVEEQEGDYCIGEVVAFSVILRIISYACNEYNLKDGDFSYEINGRIISLSYKGEDVYSYDDIKNLSNL